MLMVIRMLMFVLVDILMTYPESDADLPEDVDDGHVEVTGQKEVLARRRQKLVNE